MLAEQKTAVYTKWIRRMGTDRRLLATHISLFSALFVCYQRNDFESPFSVTRRELMSFSKIASVATYHKCIRELDLYGYVRYLPSYHPKNGSQIYWPEFTANS